MQNQMVTVAVLRKAPTLRHRFKVVSSQSSLPLVEPRLKRPFSMVTTREATATIVARRVPPSTMAAVAMQTTTPTVKVPAALFCCPVALLCSYSVVSGIGGALMRNNVKFALRITCSAASQAKDREARECDGTESSHVRPQGVDCRRVCNFLCNSVTQ